MKNYLLTTLILLSIFSIQAQNNNDDIQQNYNEVKLNGLYLVLGVIDVTYERTLNEESGVGISLFLPFDEDINADINYYISPYYRFYFGKKYAAGFFLEGFGMLNSIDRVQFQFDNLGNVIDISDNITDFALGIGFGGKWVTNKGFIGELNLGVGRNLFNNDTIDDFVGKLAITLGYRF
ncbi:hypothetical protein MNBD_BACTEROID02-180 [hydrothermal vent metagenome]|jgi:Protein of unknown function (DUF3575)|uniref:DUF3575 domain-containing protein n=1 Tax=hydrothermal vent metagenome TaxID=652676 RepID=A0A3B0R0F1_9ZZZZ